MSSIIKIVRNIKNIRPNGKNTASIEDYYTPAVYPRYDALEEYCHKLRTNPENPMATNIRLGEEDLILRVRLHRNNSKYNKEEKPEEWRFIEPSALPPLPPFNFSRSNLRTNKAPGRTLAPTPEPEDETDDEIEEERIEVDEEEEEKIPTTTTTTTTEANMTSL